MSSVHPVTKYALDVTRRRIIAGPHVIATCQRYLDDREREDIAFSTSKANRAISFFEDLLCHHTGQFSGRPFVLHPSQKFIIGSIFGWIRKENGLPIKGCPRRFKRAYIEQGRGNGKTPLAAGVALYMTMADKEDGADTFIGASTKDQAMVCFSDITRMIRSSPDIETRVRTVGKTIPDEILVPASNSRLVCISGRFGSHGAGFRPHCIVLDELHEHPDARMLESLETGFKFRRQPLLFMITNSGLHSEKSVCYQQHQHAVAVAHGDSEDDTTFSYVCGLEEGEDIFDPDLSDKDRHKLYEKANPLVGEVMSYKELDEHHVKAREMVGRRNMFLRWFMCQWTSSNERWIEREKWVACEVNELPEFKLEQLLTVGIDLSSTKDLTAIAYVVRDDEPDDPIFYAWVDIYTPEDTLEERSTHDRAPYIEWVSKGFLKTTEGKKVRYEEVARDLLEQIGRRVVNKVCYDRWSWDRFEPILVEMGGERLPLAQHPQGFTRAKDTMLWMPGSIDFLETLILEERLKVMYNPVLRMAVDAAEYKVSATAQAHRRFVKADERSRIDALVALTMAIGGAQDVKPPSPWDIPDDTEELDTEIESYDREFYSDDDDDDPEGSVGWWIT